MVKVIRVGVPILVAILFAGMALGQDAEQSLRNIQDELHHLRLKYQGPPQRDPCTGRMINPETGLYAEPGGGIAEAVNEFRCAQERAQRARDEARMRYLQNQLLEQQVKALEQGSAQSISQQPSPCRPPKEVMEKVSIALNMQRAKIAEQQKNLEEQQTRLEFLTTELQTVTKLAASLSNRSDEKDQEIASLKRQAARKKK